MKWIWHDEREIPGAQVVLTTNLMNHHIGMYSNGWWIKAGKKYLEPDKVLSKNEKIVSWAYIGGEKI